mmetsp:Transcript_50687/g.108012  ORF Transcript_50687/g.108012 Transcript_50687/m.108012 type:complete len:93 (+) Transcript_50687:1572-1850(+)
MHSGRKRLNILIEGNGHDNQQILNYSERWIRSIVMDVFISLKGPLIEMLDGQRLHVTLRVSFNKPGGIPEEPTIQRNHHPLSAARSMWVEIL